MKTTTTFFLISILLFACKKNDIREDVVGSYNGICNTTIVYPNDTVPYHQSAAAVVTVSIDPDSDGGLIFNENGIIIKLDEEYKIYANLSAFYCIIDGVFKNDSLIYSEQCTHGGYTGNFYYLKKQ